MLKGIKYVVNTNSKKEREELIDYVCSYKLAASVTNDDEHQLIAISTGDVWFLSTISEQSLKPIKYQYFPSVSNFIDYCEANKNDKWKKVF